ncbi:MAG: TetR/AcrR family transcriptional regulator [Lachnospiraceae bacterium]|nr:TetR/AcrR family transcriptional regulator [Lachnospiraceae bacterium]
MNDKFFDLKREKQDRIINAGLKVFAKHGYRHATTDDIVKEAGISKGLLFHYFTNKVGAYVFLMDYSVRFLLLELSQTVKKDTNNFFELLKQIEFGKLQVLKNYPYMQAFLDKAFEEECLEALEECELQKEVYRAKMEEYYGQAKEQKFKNNVTHEQMQELFRYLISGITTESIALDTVQPEFMYIRICEYVDMMRKAYDEI